MDKVNIKSIVYDINGNEKKVFDNVFLVHLVNDIFKDKNPPSNGGDVYYRLNLGETIVIERKKEQL